MSDEVAERVAVLVAALGLSESEAVQFTRSILQDDGIGFLLCYRRAKSALRAVLPPGKVVIDGKALRRTAVAADETNILEVVRKMLIRDLKILPSQAVRMLAKELGHPLTSALPFSKAITELIAKYDASSVLAAAHRVRNSRVHSKDPEIDWPLKDNKDKKK